jgi:hypothetical protein
MKGVRRVAELIGDHIGYPAHVADAAHGLPRPAGESAPPALAASLIRDCELPGLPAPRLSASQAQLYPLTYGAEFTQNQSGRSLLDHDSLVQDLACPPRWLRPPVADPAPNPRTPQARTPHTPRRRLGPSTTAG